MKKIILTGLLILSVTGMYGQKSNVNSAYNLSHSETPNFEAAVQNIEDALKDETTKNDAKTWYYAGLVQEKILEDQQKKAIMKADSAELRGESTIKAYDYFIKAYELDQLPDEKGKVKPKYAKSITNYMTAYQGELINYGLISYNNRKYDKALSAWERYLDMPNISFLQGKIAKDSTYYMLGYYTAMAALGNEDTDLAIKYMEMIKDDYNPDESYEMLAQLYLANKQDTIQYYNTIKAGYDKYPSNKQMLRSLVNYYLNVKPDKDKALEYVNKAIQAEPTVPDFYYIRGIISVVSAEEEKALKDFQKTLELDPDYSDALYEVGGYYLRKGDKQMSIANNIRDIKQAKQEEDKATELYKQAVTYMEKARVLNPKNVNNLRELRSLYYKIYKDENNPKYVEIGKAIREL